MGNWMIKRLRGADAVISLNADLGRELLAVGVVDEKIRVIPNGVDCARFFPPSVEERQAARATFGIPADAQVALFAGRLAEDKGIEFLIEAWRILKQRFPVSRYYLLVAGDGKRGGHYRARGATLRQATFLGMVPDIRTVLYAADLLVHPSLTEGISNIVLEAMAAGLPVIGTRIGGLVEQIQHGVTGTLVPPRDAEALAAAIPSLASDPGRRSAMGAAARRAVEQKYSFAAMVDAYEGLYAGLVSSDDHRRALSNER